MSSFEPVGHTGFDWAAVDQTMNALLGWNDRAVVVVEAHIISLVLSMCFIFVGCFLRVIDTPTLGVWYGVLRLFHFIPGSRQFIQRLHLLLLSILNINELKEA